MLRMRTRHQDVMPELAAAEFAGITEAGREWLIGCRSAGGAGRSSTAGGANGTDRDSHGFSVKAGALWIACVAVGFEIGNEIAPAWAVADVIGTF